MSYNPKPNIPPSVRRYFREQGRKGGSVSSPAKRASAARALQARRARKLASNNGRMAGEVDADFYNRDPENFEPLQSCPYGVDSQPVLHELWQRAYEDAFEVSKFVEPASVGTNYGNTDAAVNS